MTAITMGGGEVDGMDTVRSTRETITRDIVILGADEQATDAIVQSLGSVQGVTVHGVTNAIFRAHEGGMLTMRTRIPVRNRDDLSMAYTPGVARVCMAIHDNLDRAWDLTIKGNSVMVISDGSALVGQGDLGPLAALPVLEGLSLFMREMAEVDAFPLPIDLDDPAAIADTVIKIASVFGGIHVADISAPNCFEITRILRGALDIPVVHGDGEGTAAALLAGTLNGLAVVGKNIAESSICVAGSGPGAMAYRRFAEKAGAAEVRGAETQEAMRDLVKGADVYVGVSYPGSLSREDVAGMNADPVVLALGMPNPELDPSDADGVAVFATGRPDMPNQINSTLAFPGIWRGLLDVRATEASDDALMAAACAIANVVVEEGALSADYVVPSVFNKRLVPAVAEAVAEASRRSGTARISASA
jgi:malate dehydrogenase (oxaloacetate-decarboxylating)